MAGLSMIIPEEFVKKYMDVYNNNGSYAELAEMLHVKPHNVYQRVERLRKFGVKLPPLGRVRNKIKPNELNILIEKLDKRKDT